MPRSLPLLALLAVAALTAAAPLTATARRADTAKVKVHCRSGGNDAFVTPARIRIKLGDVIEWRSAGNVVADSISISLKNPDQRWPFEGDVPEGGSTVESGPAASKGTFGYNVTLMCRAGGRLSRQVIDPEIIID